MTSTTSRANGRPRPTLSDEINRLDQILDGLSDALTEAVGDAVKEVVAAALADLARRPDVLRSPPVQQSWQARPTWRDRLRRAAGRVVAIVHDLVVRAGQGIRRAVVRVRMTTDSIRSRIGNVGVRPATRLVAAAGACRAEIQDCWRRHRLAVLTVAGVLLAWLAWGLIGPFAAGLAYGGLAVALARGAGERLMGPYRTGGRPPESPGDGVQLLPVGDAEFCL